MFACAVIAVCIFIASCDGPLRPGKAGPTLVTFVALFSIMLIRAPYLLAHATDERWATLLPFIASIVWMLRQPKHRADLPLMLLLVSFIGLLAIALFRGKSAGVGIGGTQETLAFLGSVTVIPVFGVLLFTTAQDNAETWRRLVAVALAPAAYVGINVILHFAGVSAKAIELNAVSYAAGTQAKILALVGIHVTREALPMNPSIDGMGVVAAVGLVAATLLSLRTKGFERQAGVAGAIMCLVALLLTDTRAAIILAIVVIALLAIIKRSRIALLLAIIIPFSSWIVAGTLSFLSTTGLATSIARNTRDVSTGNGRIFIWEAVQHQIGKFDFFHTLFGFGSNGQSTSGTSRLYSHIFEDVPSPLLVHVHNFGLQMLLDMGVVGLAVSVITVIVGLNRLERINEISPRGPVTALIGGMLMLFLTGATEPSPTYRTQETLVYAMLLLSAAAGLIMKPVNIPVPAARRHARSIALALLPAAPPFHMGSAEANKKRAR